MGEPYSSVNIFAIAMLNRSEDGNALVSKSASRGMMLL